MIDWIIENPQLFTAGVGLVFDVVIFFIVLFRGKKAVSSDSIKLLIDENLPGSIILAEQSELDGPYKLGFVIDVILRRIRKYIKKSDDTYWISYIKDKVEAILSTPQKKEKE